MAGPPSEPSRLRGEARARSAADQGGVRRDRCSEDGVAEFVRGIQLRAAAVTLLRFTLGASSLVIAVFFAVAFYMQYWRWRDCFNDQGRCWDSASDLVYMEQSGIGWGGAVLVFAIPAVLLLWPRRRVSTDGG